MDDANRERGEGVGALSVRPATPADLDTLVEFNREMARETEGKELDAARLRQGVQGLFDDPSRGSYFVAEAGGEAVGALLVTTEWSDWRNGVFWWFQSVYVIPAARREGVFRRLYEHVDETARADPAVSGLRLYVERENRGAQAVYERVGMARSHYDMFEVDFVLGGAGEGGE